MRKITLQIRLFIIFMFHLMCLENPTYGPNSVSNILSCSTLPDFLSEMTLIILTNLRNASYNPYKYWGGGGGGGWGGVVFFTPQFVFCL